MAASVPIQAVPVRRLRTGAIVVAAVAVGLLAEHAGRSWLQPAYIPILDLGIGWLMVGCGLAATFARPAQPAGNRLVLAGFLWLIGVFMIADPPVVASLGLAAQGYYDLVLLLIALSFPGRWPASRAGMAVFAIATGCFAVSSVVRLAATLPAALGVDDPAAGTLYDLIAWTDLARITAVVAGGVVALIQLLRASPAVRSQRWLVVGAGVASAFAAGYAAEYPLTLLGFIPEIPSDAQVPLAWTINAIRMAVPLAMLAGVLQLHEARSALAGAVGRMQDEASVTTLQSALATAVGDPGLRVLAWTPGVGAYVDAAGSRVEDDELDVLAHDPARSLVPLESEDGPLAVLVLASPVAEDPALVRACVAVTRLVVRNERQAERIREQLDEVRASRARIVAAADAERRRIERDLHDGLQQRMLGVALELRSAENRPGNQAAALRRGSDDVLAILETVRELARGIHPAVLTEAGLGPAIRAAADRSPVPVELDLRLEGHGSRAAQATAYFVVSEALANVAKHAANASAVWIVADDAGTSLAVAVEDDGPGGADPAGAGLAGLADRVAALGGRLAVEPRPGGGTRIAAEVPLG